MHRGLTRDTIAGMVATTVREVTNRNNHEQARLAREVARNKAYYAEAEEHAKPLLDGLSLVKDLSNGRFDFEVLSNLNKSLSQDNPDHIGIDVNIRLKGLGRFSRNPEWATVDDVNPSFQVTYDGKLWFYGKLMSLEGAISTVVRLSAEANLFPASVVPGHKNG